MPSIGMQRKNRRSVADAAELRAYLALIKKAVLAEGELTEWVNKELAAAESTRESYCTLSELRLSERLK